MLELYGPGRGPHFRAEADGLRRLHTPLPNFAISFA
jgi:hypothetical protein